MANEEHLALLRRGGAAWHQWRKKHPEIQPDLCSTDALKVNLSNFDLSYFDLSRTALIAVDLDGANFRGANLNGACFTMANLRGANFTEANLSNAYLGEADLSTANFCAADLSATNFNWAILRGTHLKEAKNLNQADFTSASFHFTDLSGTNLSGAKLDLTHFDHVDLRGTNLSNANLCGAELREAHLDGADLQGAFLSGANLVAAHLSNAKLINANLVATDLYSADLRGANLSSANLSRASAVWTNFTRAKLTGCRVYGISAWNAQLEEAIQDNLIITPEDEPMVVVDDLEIAQFIYLLLSHNKLRDVFNAVTERGVLLLGCFGGGGLELLQAIAAKLREAKYLPIIFDFERPQDRDCTETVKTLAGLSRFIVADLSGPSVPKELEVTVPDYKIPFAFICQADAKPFAMSSNLFGYPWVLQPVLLFSAVEDLLAKLPTRVIAPAEEMTEKIHRAKEKTLDELFPSE